MDNSQIPAGAVVKPEPKMFEMEIYVKGNKYPITSMTIQAFSGEQAVTEAAKCLKISIAKTYEQK